MGRGLGQRIGYVAKNMDVDFDAGVGFLPWPEPDRGSRRPGGFSTGSSRSRSGHPRAVKKTVHRVVVAQNAATTREISR